ncbi:MAG TPA: hypothetical protein PKC18_01225 [Lacipirellulaceae bacterium]|nr:hypothetical protein [Lacipirellulaceae bacterium]
MFRPSESTTRRLCRAAFVALCVAPTLATLAWIGWNRRPDRARAEASRLGSTLLVHVAVDGWTSPRPGVARTAQLTLAAPGEQTPGVQLTNVTITRSGRRIQIEADDVALEAPRLAEHARRLQAALSELRTASIHIRAGCVSVRGPADAEYSVRDAVVSLEVSEAGALKLQCEAHGNSSEEADSIRVIGERASPGGELAVAVDARRGELPAWLLGVVAPAVAGVNGSARFTGVAQMGIAADGTRGQLQGPLDGVELAALLPAGSPHRIAGVAKITIAALQWRDGRLESIDGSIDAANVAASRSLIESAASALTCGQTDLGISTPQLHLDRLACRFQFDRRGLTLQGLIALHDNAPPSCLATTGGRPLLFEPQAAGLPAGAWVRFLAAPGPSWLPATEQAVDMAHRLPLPTSPESR